MARPSKTAPNMGVVEVNGYTRKALAVWNPERRLFLLKLKSHGRLASTISVGRTIKSLKRQVGFRMVQA